MIRRSDRDRHNRQGWLVTSLRDKRGPIRYEDVLRIVNAIIGVQYARFRIRSHARRTTLMNVLAENT